jgi:hypothetical protein
MNCHQISEFVEMIFLERPGCYIKLSDVPLSPRS